MQRAPNTAWGSDRVCTKSRSPPCRRASNLELGMGNIGHGPHNANGHLHAAQGWGLTYEVRVPQVIAGRAGALVLTTRASSYTHRVASRACRLHVPTKPVPAGRAGRAAVASRIAAPRPHGAGRALDAVADRAAAGRRHYPGRNPPFFASKRPARPHERTPCRADSLWRTLRARKRPARARTVEALLALHALVRRLELDEPPRLAGDAVRGPVAPRHARVPPRRALHARPGLGRLLVPGVRRVKGSAGLKG
jgi:hypothetical protein